MDQALREIIGKAVEEVWGMFLDLEVRPAEPSELRGERLIALLPISGEQEWTLALECSAAFARMSAAVMFAQPPEQLSTEQLHDAAGELANMTAGYVRRALPSSCSLSLPTIAGDSALLETLGREVTAAAFERRGERLRIRLFMR